MRDLYKAGDLVWVLDIGGFNRSDPDNFYCCIDQHEVVRMQSVIMRDGVVTKPHFGGTERWNPCEQVHKDYDNAVRTMRHQLETMKKKWADVINEQLRRFPAP